MISDAGLTNYKELKRLADNQDKWKNYGKLQNQPQGWSQKNKILYNINQIIHMKHK